MGEILVPSQKRESRSCIGFVGVVEISGKTFCVLVNYISCAKRQVSDDYCNYYISKGPLM